ncbi:hypothetical protein JW948_10635 [bacterium]|nr:hypothetical protein [bacterium]
MMKRFKNRWLIWTIPVTLMCMQYGVPASPISEKWTIGLELGSWQPHSLNDEPRFDTFGAAGATPYTGLALSIPAFGDLAMKIGLGYWALRDLNEVENIHKLVIHPLTLDFKYWLVPDDRLSAYVLYGGGIFWGVENETLPFGERLRTARSGWGINLGAGFDFAFSRRVGVGMTFQYHYVIFKNPLGGVDDFSGPRITGGFLIFLGD